MINSESDPLNQDQTSNAAPAMAELEPESLETVSIGSSDQVQAQPIDEEAEALAAAMAIMSKTAPVDDDSSESDSDDLSTGDGESSDDSPDKTASSSAHPDQKSGGGKNSYSQRIGALIREANLHAADAETARLENERLRRDLKSAADQINDLSNQLLEMRKLEMQINEIYKQAGQEPPNPSAAAGATEASYPSASNGYSAPAREDDQPLTVGAYRKLKQQDDAKTQEEQELERKGAAFRNNIESAIRNSSNPDAARSAFNRGATDALELAKKGSTDLGTAIKALAKMEYGADILVALQHSKVDYRTLSIDDLMEKISKFYSIRKGNATQDTRSRSVEQPRSTGAPKTQKETDFSDPDARDAWLAERRKKRLRGEI